MNIINHYSQETKNLEGAWNRWPNEKLARFMRRSPFHPQHYFTINAILDFISKKNLEHDFFLEKNILAPIIKLYFHNNTWMRERKKILRKVLETLEVAATLSREKRLQYALIKKVSILDVGCGSGNYYANFKKRGLDKYIMYHGVDIAKKNIDNSKLLFPDVKFSVGNINKLDFPESFFDIVFVSHVFEHLPPYNLPQALKEVLRVAKSSVIINFFNEKDIKDHVIEQRPSSIYWNCLSRRKIKDLVENLVLGIEITDIYPGFTKKVELLGEYGVSSYSSWILSLNKK